MDKFVVKKKRDLQTNQQTGSKKKQLTQSTLQALSGVVVIEELESFKSILESDSEPIEEKIRILNKLHEKNPSKEVLIKVGIGKTVNILRRGQEAVLLLGGVGLTALTASFLFFLSVSTLT